MKLSSKIHKIHKIVLNSDSLNHGYAGLHASESG